MSSAYRVTSTVYTVLWLIVGTLLFLIPGRFLGALSWPFEPITARVLGAALLTLAWASYRGWRTRNRELLSLVMELGIIFSFLAALGVLRHLLITNYPPVVWGAFAAFGLFGALWLVALVRR